MFVCPECGEQHWQDVVEYTSFGEDIPSKPVFWLTCHLCCFELPEKVLAELMISAEEQPKVWRQTYRNEARHSRRSVRGVYMN